MWDSALQMLPDRSILAEWINTALMGITRGSISRPQDLTVGSLRNSKVGQRDGTIKHVLGICGMLGYRILIINDIFFSFKLCDVVVTRFSDSRACDAAHPSDREMQAASSAGKTSALANTNWKRTVLGQFWTRLAVRC